ncbi:MAG TPA: ATP-binding cassette domain-containing protein, partial [Ktedonobacterales bacterium]|nr:ATP-binding cassette domain-containing protein [Ktedonobacterales bacterium]
MATIEFQHVTRIYPDADTPAVNDVSFTVPEGALCMLVGTSGSGKTTLLRMVNRLIDPTAGQILIDGVPTTTQDPIALRRGIGYVIQQVGLFPHMTVEENVRVVPSILGKSAREMRGRVDELLTLVGLDPDQYRARYPRQLSGGQQQRVGLARALAADPDILLMDEPFGALDAITREHLQDELLRIQRELRKTVLFVSHDVSEAFRLGDQVVVMHDGKLVQVGTPVDLISHPADDFVRQLVGADSTLRQLEYLPVTAALEPQDGVGAFPLSGETLPTDSTLLTALLLLLKTNADKALVIDHGEVRGQVSLNGIYRAVRSPSENVAAG